jgi:hypothetical protein
MIRSGGSSYSGRDDNGMNERRREREGRRGIVGRVACIRPRLTLITCEGTPYLVLFEMWGQTTIRTANC